MSEPNDHSSLRRDLVTIRDQATGVLKTEQRRRERRPALEVALWISVAIATLYVLYAALANLVSASWPTASFPVLAMLIVIPGLLFLVVRLVAAGGEGAGASRFRIGAGRLERV